MVHFTLGSDLPPTFLMLHTGRLVKHACEGLGIRLVTLCDSVCYMGALCNKDIVDPMSGYYSHCIGVY